MTRLYTDYNLTPIQLPNPAWDLDKSKPRWVQNYPCDAYAASLGFERAFMVYDGTLNRATRWANDDLTLRPANDLRPDEGNHSSPPDDFAVKACAKLAMQADHYVAGTPRSRPIMFDLEGGMWSEWDAKSALTVAQHFATMTKAIRTARDAANGHLHAGAFGWPNQIDYLPDATAEMREWAITTSYVAPCFYTVPSLIPDAAWFDEVETRTSYIDRLFPHLPRIAVLCPTYQVWWKDSYPDLAPLDGKPVPSGLWKKQLKFVIDRGYDVMLWAGPTPLTPDISYLYRTARDMAA